MHQAFLVIAWKPCIIQGECRERLLKNLGPRATRATSFYQASHLMRQTQLQPLVPTSILWLSQNPRKDPLRPWDSCPFPFFGPWQPGAMPYVSFLALVERQVQRAVSAMHPYHLSLQEMETQLQTLGGLEDGAFHLGDPSPSLPSFRCWSRSRR